MNSEQICERRRARPAYPGKPGEGRYPAKRGRGDPIASYDPNTCGKLWWARGSAEVTACTPAFGPDTLYASGGYPGVATCFDAASGSPLWKARLGGDFTASPTLAGGIIFAAGQSGTTFLFKSEAGYQPVAQNELGEGIFASPVISGGQLFQRTSRALYAIGKAAPASGPPRS
jgi:outer membrane protein assembly factor BamB